MAKITVRVCTGCRQEKDSSEYGKAAREPDGTNRQCKTCRRSAVSRSRLKKGYDPVYNRASSLKTRYGISLEQYRAQLAYQCGMCAICGTHDGRLVVDHCHATGRNRGLLCAACNLALGKFNDSTESLAMGIVYLKGGEFHG